MEGERKPDEDEASLPLDFMGGVSPLFDWERNTPHVRPTAPEQTDALGDPERGREADRPLWGRLTQLFK